MMMQNKIISERRGWCAEQQRLQRQCDEATAHATQERLELLVPLDILHVELAALEVVWCEEVEALRRRLEESAVAFLKSRQETENRHAAEADSLRRKLQAVESQNEALLAQLGGSADEKLRCAPSHARLSQQSGAPVCPLCSTGPQSGRVATGTRNG